MDPVEIGAAELRRQQIVDPVRFFEDIGGAEVMSAIVLDALHEAGWRIVKEGCKNPDAGLNCGCHNMTFAEEWKPR